MLLCTPFVISVRRQDVLSTQNGRTKGKAGPTEVASGPLEASGVVNPSTDGAARVDSEQVRFLSFSLPISIYIAFHFIV